MQRCCQVSGRFETVAIDAVAEVVIGIVPIAECEKC